MDYKLPKRKKAHRKWWNLAIFSLAVITLFAIMVEVANGSAAIDRNITVKDLSPAQIETLRWLYRTLDGPHFLVNVAFCESSLSHYEADGKTVKRGRVDQADTGVLQINVRIHKQGLKRLGLDATKRGDNLVYGQYLQKRDGRQPWAASKHCWSNLRLPSPHAVGVKVQTAAAS